MDLLQEMHEIFSKCENCVEVKNYYYENHNCEKSGETKKILMDFILSHETTDKILRFGYCSECKTLFFHKDFNTRSF